MIDPFIQLGDAAQRVVENLRPARAGIETWPVTDRAAWLERRQKDVTASAIGALLGTHDYLTPYALFALKSGLVTEDPEETPAMVRGRLLEPVAIELLRELHPAWTITTPHAYWRDSAMRIGGTPDSLAKNPRRKGFGVLQIKSVEPSIFRRKWRTEDGTIEPPTWIAIQALVEAHLTGASWAAVAAMRVGFGLDIDVIDIPLHSGLIARIETEVAAFWRSVESGQPPDPDLHRDAALIEKLYRPNGKTIDLTADNLAMELADERERLSAEQKGGKERLSEIKSELLLKLNGASAGRLADGRLIAVSKVNVKEHMVSASVQTRLTIKKARNAA